MVGLVFVSHSRAVAHALRAMVGELFGDRVPVAVAAGAGDDGELLGTDATAIVAATEGLAATCEGVLVLLDLGSAVLSAETALDLLDDAVCAKVALCAAPLVEGAVAAAAQCSIGASLAAVRAEAEGALRQKTEHLGAPVHASGPSDRSLTAGKGGEPVTADLRIENAAGLHARPAMRIVQAMASFRAEVELQNLRTGAPAVSARSLVALTCLEARPGDTVRATARGDDAAVAIQALRNLHAERFGDPPSAVPQDGESAGKAVRAAANAPVGALAEGSRRLRGKALSAGCALGRLVAATKTAPPPPPEPGGTHDPAEEFARLARALDAVRREITTQMAEASGRLGEEGAAILEVQRTLATDPALVDTAAALIREPSTPLRAEHAWQQACRSTAETYRRLGDPLLRERVGDVEDLEERVLGALGVRWPGGEQIIVPGEPGILAVATLRPSQVTALDPKQVLGIIAEAVGATSHAAILLRAAGIPTVDGVPGDLLRGLEEKVVALDGETGEVWLEPDTGQRTEFEQRRAREEAERAGQGVTEDSGPLHTRDGRRIELAANVASPAEAKAAARLGAEGIGLLRTEFLFLDQPTPPAEDEQTEALRAVVGELPPRAPVTVRTLDIGGDKPVPFLPVAPEDNPFLGVRGVRLTLRSPEMFLTHLRAILRAGRGRKLRVMFPMVTTIEEIRRARAWLARAHEELASSGREHAWPIETGMMIEVPAAALLANRFAPEVDFFSVGTNDLTQYTLAAERGHPVLVEFSDAMHPAVLRLIACVTAAARRHGKWVGVCGEAAVDPVAAGVFVGLGVNELSMGPNALPQVRRKLGKIDATAARRVARRCLRAEDAEDARAAATEAFDGDPLAAQVSGN